MPCRDDYAEEQESKELYERVKMLEFRNDTLMRILCAADTALKDNRFWETFVAKNPDAMLVIIEHRAQDENRWYTEYHSLYPQFSKEEIAKMVRAGILEDK